MRQTVFKLLLWICLLGISGCSDSEPANPNSKKTWTDVTVAVVLPMDKGLDAHWKRTLEMFSANFERAFKNQDHGIRIEFEYHDESDANIAEMAKTLAFDNNIDAVIGGLYSGNAEILASELTRMGKTFFTLATSEQLVRAYASTGYLWAMTETDITQCEVLLSKVVNYGGKSVALLAKDDNSYGRTFLDWFAFQAKELGLENKVHSPTRHRQSTRWHGRPCSRGPNM